MFKNYLTIAIRNLARHKAYSLINIAGLAVGMACCIVVLLFIQNEFRYNTHHPNADRVYRVVIDFGKEGISSVQYRGDTSGALGPAVRAELPEIERVTRLFKDFSEIIYNDQSLGGKSITLIEPGFLQFFDVPFIRGNSQTALNDPYAIIVSESFAHKTFGTEDPIGKILTFNSRYWGGEYTVTGIIKDDPHTSIYSSQIFHATPPRDEYALSEWEGWITKIGVRHTIHTYLCVSEGTDLDALEHKLTGLLHKNTDKTEFSYHLQPLKRIHLYSRADYNLVSFGNINRVYLYAGIAAFILLIACINFMNLSTARAMGRAREVGLRKVVGARQTQLIAQFLGESLVIALFSIVLALGLVELSLPAFNGLANTDLALTDISFYLLITGLIGVATTVGLIAGSYPAFYLSHFNPTNTLSGSLHTGPAGAYVRKGLVVFQFALSIFLIASTNTVQSQLHYMQNTELGFDKDRIVLVPIFLHDQQTKLDRGVWLSDRYQTVKRAVQNLPGVEKVSAFRFTPGWGAGFLRDFRPEDYGEDIWRIPVQEADEDYLNTFGLQLVTGRNFSTDRATDLRTAYILNEAAVKELGWDDPIGKQLRRVGQDHTRDGTVIGVVKDFHHNSLHAKIGPAAIMLYPRFFRHLAVKIKAGHMEETLAHLETTWSEFVPNKPFAFWFLEDNINQAYWQEQRLATVFTWFSGLAIGLACLGLFGLAAYTAETRTREIGIRKVLGATISGIVTLLSKDFLKLVLIANLIAWPIAYYVLHKWLATTFAYRIDLGIGLFILSGLLALLIALLTVSYQAIKVARANPVDALRHE